MDVPVRLYFDHWAFQRQPPELVRHGIRVRLQEQPLQVLDELLARPGEIVTREQLIARLWPKRIVEFDAALNAAVRRLRAALGDEAESPRYIETVPRKGYRFIGTLRLSGLSGLSEPAPILGTEPPARRVGGRYRLALALTFAVAVIALGSFGITQWRASNAAKADAVAAINEPLRRAEFFTHRRSPGDLVRAREQYERALAFDASSARAWAGLATVHWLAMADGEQPRAILLPKVGAAAQRALDLDPLLAEAHLRMAQYLTATGDPSGARKHSARAAELQPNDPLLLGILAGEAADAGRWEEAIVLQRRAAAADPLSATAVENLADYLFLAGRREEANREFEKVLELDPTHPKTIAVLTEILEGRYEDALREAQSWPESDVRDQGLALAYHGLGRSAESDEHLGKLIATRGWDKTILVAEVYAFRGEFESAFKWLATRPELCVSPLLYASPFLKPLQADSRWARLTATAHKQG